MNTPTPRTCPRCKNDFSRCDEMFDCANRRDIPTPITDGASFGAYIADGSGHVVKSVVEVKVAKKLERDLAAREAELAATRKREKSLDDECGMMLRRLDRVVLELAQERERAEAAERKAEESARDAARYRFIRDDDNWQDDAPDTATWDNLGELSMAEFDAAVDKKMSAAYWEKNPIQAAIAAKGEA